MATRNKTTVRLPDDLHRVVTEEADRRGVSLNSLIIIIMAEWVESIGRLRVALDKARKEDDGA